MCQALSIRTFYQKIWGRKLPTHFVQKLNCFSWKVFAYTHSHEFRNTIIGRVKRSSLGTLRESTRLIFQRSRAGMKQIPAVILPQLVPSKCHNKLNRFLYRNVTKLCTPICKDADVKQLTTVGKIRLIEYLPGFIDFRWWVIRVDGKLPQLLSYTYVTLTFHYAK